MKSFNRIQQVLSLVICMLIVASLAIVKNGELWGHDFKSDRANPQVVCNDTLRTLDDGAVVINTSPLASDITGYGGKVPLEITIKDGVVVNVKAKENAETKDFFDRASVLLDKWNGKTIDEASNMQVDAVSGATFSSKAIIGNMQRGLQYAKANLEKSSSGQGRNATSSSGNAAKSLFGNAADSLWTLKNVMGLLVVLMAAILPLFIKNKKYHLFQLVLNVVVLGFWCGAFLSYTSLLGYVSHGVNVLALLVPMVMVVTAFVYPLFGKKSYYCTHVCPFGSMQQIAGKCIKYKIKMSPKTLRRLDLFRQLLWAALMLCIWGGVWSDWTDFEPFSAFIFQSASWVVIVIALVFIALSFVVTRPYCRFVCPMGTLLRLSQNSKV